VIEGDAKLINFNYFFTRKLNFVKETTPSHSSRAGSAPWTKDSKC
jgi:hypothetical protein